MSFYHVLPSNVAPNIFPNNHASAFSIPLDNPYTLSGQWEVAMMNMSYTGCVNTFYNDVLTINRKTDLKTRILKTATPVMWRVPQKKTLEEMFDAINQSLKTILKADIKEQRCTWKLESKDMFVILSPSLTKVTKLSQDVITSWDLDATSFSTINIKDAMPEDISVTFVPITYLHHDIEVKAENEALTIQQCVTRFNERVLTASMKEKSNTLQITGNKKDIIILSPELRQFVNYEQSGIYKKNPRRVYTANAFMSMSNPWKVSVYALHEIEQHTSPLMETVTLSPVSFQRRQDAVAFLNEHVPHVKFAIDKKDYLQVAIADASLRLTFSDTLRDIFAFDQNTYSGIGTYKATGIFSLTRRIHYLYVYSSITDYVRIGNTEAPLLAVIPFSVSSSCDILKEETFKNPMYVPIRHTTVSQIDIEIHDDAGALVPFVSEAVTSLRLHYRQI